MLAISMDCVNEGSSIDFCKAAVGQSTLLLSAWTPDNTRFNTYS